MKKLSSNALYICVCTYAVSICGIASANWSITKIDGTEGDYTYPRDIYLDQVVGGLNISESNPWHAFIKNYSEISIDDNTILGPYGISAYVIDSSGQEISIFAGSSGHPHSSITTSNVINKTDLVKSDDVMNWWPTTVTKLHQEVSNIYSSADDSRPFITSHYSPNIGQLENSEFGAGFTSSMRISGQVIERSEDRTGGGNSFISTGIAITSVESLSRNIKNTFTKIIDDSNQLISSQFIDASASTFPSQVSTGIDGIGTADFADLRSSRSSHSFQINIINHGQAVGTSSASDGASRSLILANNGGTADILTLQEAVSARSAYLQVIDINNIGSILGYGYRINDPVHYQSFRTVSTPSHLFIPPSPPLPIPEPSIYVMILAGLGLMGFMARRKSNGLRRNLEFVR